MVFNLASCLTGWQHRWPRPPAMEHTTRGDYFCRHRQTSSRHGGHRAAAFLGGVERRGQNRAHAVEPAS